MCVISCHMCLNQHILLDSILKESLRNIQKAIKGLVVMSEELERVYTSFLNNQVPLSTFPFTLCDVTLCAHNLKVPIMWATAAYPSLKPLSSWVKDLTFRLHFIEVHIVYSSFAFLHLLKLILLHILFLCSTGLRMDTRNHSGSLDSSSLKDSSLAPSRTMPGSTTCRLTS